MVNLGPLWALFASYLLPVLVAAISVLVPWVLAKQAKLTGIDIDAGHRAALMTAIDNAIGGILANVGTSIGAKAIDLGNPLLDTAVNYVISAVPDAVKHFGLADKPAVIALKIKNRLALALNGPPAVLPPVPVAVAPLLKPAASLAAAPG